MGRYVRWLIERGQAVGHDPVLWWADSPARHPESSTGCWTNIAALAKIFETRESAQRYADVYAGPLCVVTEHIFLDAEVSPVDVIGIVVDEFLRWPLPDTVCSDPCVCTTGYPNRTGTNLLTASEARQMFEYIIGKAPRASSHIERAATCVCYAKAEQLERELSTLRERLAEAERECEDWRKNAAAYRKDMLLAKDRAERVEQDAERYRFLRAETDRVDPVAAVSWKWKMNRESSEWANTSCAKSLDELCDGQIAARSAT